jgi:Membrane protein involved in the export of O-antigen and teichoic acid
MRVRSTLLNVTVGLGNQLIVAVLSFVSRTVFIHSLGLDYLGINALFTSVLAMLSLAEAGIGSSIVYSLYKPVAERDEPRIMALMGLYKRAYAAIAAAVMALGLLLLPFLHLFVGDTEVERLELIYLLFLLNTAAPYLFIYKHSFLNVNQKNYIVTAVFSVSFIVSTCAKIAILHFTQNYLLFLALESALTIATSILLSRMADRMYPILKRRERHKLDAETKASFIRNMKAIMLQNVGNYFIFGVDSILISSFISVAAVGLYSNYKMIIDLCRTFVNQVFANMYHSIGNLVAQETKDTVYRIYKVSWLLNFWLYAFLAIMLYMFMDPLIELWLGESFLLGQAAVVLLVVTFYERGLRNTITTVKTTAGIFHADRLAPIAQAAVNLGLSLLLVRHWGLAGIFAGTLVSSLAVPFWSTPYLVYAKVFQVPLIRYYARYFYYLAVGLAAWAAAEAAVMAIPGGHIGWLVLKAAAAAVVINVCFAAVFYRTDEFGYLKGVALRLIGKIPLPRRKRRRRMPYISRDGL